MHNGYNYRTLNPWEQIALEHLSAVIAEIIGAGFDNSETLTDRINDLIIEVTCWSASNCDEEITEILDDSPNDTQQPIPYGTSGEDGDKEINPSWGDSEEEDETRVPGFQDVDYESAYIYANRPDPVEDDILY